MSQTFPNEVFDWLSLNSTSTIRVKFRGFAMLRRFLLLGLGLAGCDAAVAPDTRAPLDLKIQQGKQDNFAVSFILGETSAATTLHINCDEPDGCTGTLRLEVVAPDACVLLLEHLGPAAECGPGMEVAQVTVAHLSIDSRDEQLPLQVATLDGENFVTSVEVPLSATFEEVVTVVITQVSGMPDLHLRATWEVSQPSVLRVFFDDFNYTSPQDAEFLAHGWRARTQGGGPGPLGATWSAEQVVFLTDPDDTQNGLLRLIARTTGTAEGTTQAEVFSPQRFFEGTYAARVRHTDSPALGPDVDGVVQTFFSITPWSYAASLDYCEVDFEYLPNGGWGVDGSTMWQTTWEVAEPAVSRSSTQNFSHEGWRTLVFVIGDGNVQYFVDGVLVSTHGGEHYPESKMGIHFNHWFITNMLNESSEERVWHQDVDWVFFADEVVLSPTEVLEEVESFRDQGTRHHDFAP